MTTSIIVRKVRSEQFLQPLSRSILSNTSMTNLLPLSIATFGTCGQAKVCGCIKAKRAEVQVHWNCMVRKWGAGHTLLVPARFSNQSVYSTYNLIALHFPDRLFNSIDILRSSICLTGHSVCVRRVKDRVSVNKPVMFSLMILSATHDAVCHFSALFSSSSRVWVSLFTQSQIPILMIEIFLQALSRVVHMLHLILALVSSFSYLYQNLTCWCKVL